MPVVGRTVGAFGSVGAAHRSAGQIADLHDYNVLADLLNAIPRHEQVLGSSEHAALAVRQDYALDLAALHREHKIDDVPHALAVTAVNDLAPLQLAIRHFVFHSNCICAENAK